MTATASDRAASDIELERVRWSSASDTLKHRIDRARVTALLLSSTGAVATTLTVSLSDLPTAGHRALAVTGALLLAVATFLSTQYLTADAARRWVQARAVSESIKGEVYRFRAHVKPYTEDNGLALLRAKVGDLQAAAVNLEPYLPEAGPALASTSLDPLTPEDYAHRRVEQQITDYYRPKARLNATRARRLRAAAVGLSFAATLVAALNAKIDSVKFVGLVAPWVAVLTTMGTALVVYLGARRYEFLVVSYTSTANRLQNRLNRWRSDGSPTDDAAWSDFVEDCETAIAEENSAWLAKWSDGKSAS